MEETEFDRKLIAAAFDLAAIGGWRRVRVARAAREAGLPLDQARARFPGTGAILMKFGRLADQAALATASAEGDPRDRLFDLFMQRLEFMQSYRPGVLAVLRAVPMDPPLALLLGATTRRSVGWLLEACGVDTFGLEGSLRVSGAMAVWLWAVRAWQRDETEDLASTMTALDRALSRAEQAAGWLRGRGARPVAEPDSEPGFDEAVGMADDSLPVVLPDVPPETSVSPPPADV